MTKLSLFLLFLLSSSSAAAQSPEPLQTKPAEAPPPVVSAGATEGGLRVVATEVVTGLRLELFSATGERLFDSGFREGSLLDWALPADQTGDGSYLFVVTAREAGGRRYARRGLLHVEGGRARTAAFVAETLSAAQAAAWNQVPGREVGDEAAADGVAPFESVVVREEGVVPALTVAGHDGRDGLLVATRGGFSFRAGDLFKGRERELLHLTPEGDALFSGSVTARGGIRFADGTTLASARDARRLVAAEGDEVPAPAATGTGTQGRLAKWLETGGAGTLGDSIIIETPEGNLGISNPNPTTKLSVLGAPGAELRFDKGAQSITPVLNVISQPASTTLGGAAGLAAGGGGTSFNFSDNLPFFIVKDTKANVVNNNLGFGTPLFTVLPSGNVGVGTTNPTSKLQVAGNVNFIGLRTENTASTPNVVGGFSGNAVTAGVFGATIGGGGVTSLINRVTDDFGTVGGGRNNRAGDNAGTTSDRSFATVGGGRDNTASGGTSTVGGGFSNTASGTTATVGGGDGNTASGGISTVGGGNSNTASSIQATVGGGGGNIASSTAATVGGGFSNTASNDGATVGGGNGNVASGILATIGGGTSNIASGFESTVPGGRSNTAAGDFSFAAGRRAKANHIGAFVWADSTDADFASTAADQFLVRAAGGVGIGINAPTARLTVAGAGIFAAAGAARLDLTNTTAAATFSQFVTDGGAWQLNAGGSARLAVSATGNVGVATTSPTATLHVAGNLKVNTLGASGNTPLCRNAANEIATCTAINAAETSGAAAPADASREQQEQLAAQQRQIEEQQRRIELLEERLRALEATLGASAATPQPGDDR